MSRNKESNAKMDPRLRMLEFCQGCFARFVKFGGSLDSIIGVCREFAVNKVFPKNTATKVK